ncbi:MAG: chemotaxis protein CheD [Nitrosomonadales bacterium]|nr:chemotaxis protein CheD [Nitrosomonadales bacterium]
MHKPAHVIEIFLQPGDFYFGDRNTRIRTLLGSCVSIICWHPHKLIGGMCHYMLSSRGKPRGGELDGKYADEAMEMFLREIRAAQTQPSEYQVKLFGAGNMFPLEGNRDCRGCTPEKAYLKPKGACPKISCQNHMAAYYLVQLHGFTLQAEHLGGRGHRQLLFDIWSGNAWMKHVPASVPLSPSIDGVAGKEVAAE